VWLRVTDAAGVAVRWFKLDVFPPCQNGLTTTEVDIGPAEVVETFVVKPQVVLVDELGHTLFELTW